MNDCEVLRDRMPEVAHGGDPWTVAEAAHLAACESCAAEWPVIKQGAMLYADLPIAVDVVAERVVRQLRAAGARPSVIGRIGWRTAMIGLTAVAATVALLLRPTPARRPIPDIAMDTAALGVLPELQGLNQSELQAVMQTLPSGNTDTVTSAVPHLDDLTDTELEQLLRSEGGE
ncbi:MAG TPA: hypothetical protein VGM77_08875 [Gemmatimonadales bacterium]|jgi:hypothetical protein